VAYLRLQLESAGDAEHPFAGVAGLVAAAAEFPEVVVLSGADLRRGGSV